MKRSRIIVLSVCAALIVSTVLLLIIYRPVVTPTVREKFKPDLPFAVGNWLNIGPYALAAAPESYVFSNTEHTAQADGAFLFEFGDRLGFTVDVPEAGSYRLALAFVPAAESLNDYILEAQHAGRTDVVQFYPVWTDSETRYVLDDFGNEFSARQVMALNRQNDYLRAYSGVNKAPVSYALEAGTAEFSLTNMSEPVYVYGLYAVPEDTAPSYAQYLADAEAAYGNGTGGQLITLEAEDCSLKSDSFIAYSRGKDIGSHPYDTYRKMISGLSSSQWFRPGQKVLWEFEVQEPGFYHIALRYSLGASDNIKGYKNSFRNVEVDGRPLFDEMNGYMLPFTGGRADDHTLASQDGEAFRVYLTPGRHTISLEATTADGQELVDEIKALVDDINAIGMDLKKLAAGGGTAAGSQTWRTWDMSVYLPDAVPALTRYADVIDGLYDRISVYNRSEPTFANGLKYTQDAMRRLLKEQRTLPNQTEKLMEGDNSVSAVLGDVVAQITRQDVALDRLYIYGAQEPPVTDSSFVRQISENLHQVISTLAPDAAKSSIYASYDRNDESLNVWLLNAVQFAETLRTLTATSYENKSGIDINISFIIDKNQLVLANASGDNPDLVVGFPYADISNFAIRGAAKNLLEYDEFLPFYNEQYDLESLRPLSYDGKVFGAVDSHSMYLLYYRKDILDALGLTVPETWDDVEAMLPKLLTYSMNFYTPVAYQVAKGIDSTAPFFFQNGGELYAPDGLSSSINEGASVTGFAAMTDLWKIYGARESVPNFINSFRYGEVPIGIDGAEAYFRLTLAAPELAGKWGIALIPGVRQEDGSIRRDYPSAMRASMIFNNTAHPQEAYDYLEWWLSAETQLDFTYYMRTTYGPEYYWIPGNLDTMRQMYFPPEDLDIIMEQRGYEREVFRHLAWYMLERNISNAWNNVVKEDENIMVSLDRAAVDTDREIRRKLIEFGYIDEAGNILKEYRTDTVEQLRARMEGAAS